MMGAPRRAHLAFLFHFGDNHSLAHDWLQRILLLKLLFLALLFLQAKESAFNEVGLSVQGFCRGTYPYTFAGQIVLLAFQTSIHAMCLLSVHLPIL